MELPVLITALGLVVVLLVVTVLLMRQNSITRRFRRGNAELAVAVRFRDEELDYFVTTRLPKLIDSMRDLPVTPHDGLHAELATVGFGHGLDTVLARFADTMAKATDHADQSAKATLKTIMRRIQSLANEQRLDISTMQDQHDNPDVLEGLLKIAHANSQLIRRTQAIAVLCGSWPRQQRTASTLADVVRGATSRIRDYPRVALHSEWELAVASRAVEPVVLAVAELLDNATRHSRPDSSVEVNFQRSHHGMAIVIDDAGVGMTAEETKNADALLSTKGLSTKDIEGDEQHPVDIGQLGDPPRIGFAVIGILAARYGFTVSVDMRSPYGGTRAIVFLPNALLTTVSSTPAATDAESPVTEQRHNGAPAPGPADEVQQTTAGGLPKRRRRQPVPQGSVPAEAGISPSPLGSQAPLVWARWQRGTRSGRQ